MEIENCLNPNLLNRMEKISAAASAGNLNSQKLTAVSDDISEVSKFLSITADQAVFFSGLTELSFQKQVSLDSLAKHFKSSVMKLVSSMHELEALEKKGYIHKNIRKRGRNYSYNDLGFSVPHNVIEALRKADASLLSTTNKFELPGFLKQISDTIEERNESIMSTSDLIEEAEALISKNIELPFVSYVNKSLVHTLSKCFVFALSYLRLKGRSNLDSDFFYDAVFDDFSEQLQFAQMIANGSHELIKKDILRLESSEFEGDKAVVLSDKTTKVLFQAYPALLSDPKNSGLIPSSTLTEKKLYFNSGVGEQVRSLEDILKTSRFKAYRKELKKNKLKEGMTAIFFGAPGTGKTEAVYQIARKTERDIMMVDLSQTKSKWYGESEKVVKKIFDDYAGLLKVCNKEPILFINEADGFFSKRLDMNGSRSSTTDQTNNVVQNILLQALENFEGILFATTNLTENLDKAFERRFSFRINFAKPDVRARQSIWKSKLPYLTERNAALLAEKFEITGGEIDVQVRQVILKKVLNKKADVFDLLVESCRKGNGFESRKKLGF